MIVGVVTHLLAVGGMCHEGRATSLVTFTGSPPESILVYRL